MAKRRLLIKLVLLCIAVGGISFGGQLAWSLYKDYTALDGKWVLRTSAMVEEMLQRGASQDEARAFVRATSAGKSWMTVDGTDVVRVTLAGEERITIERGPASKGCWAVTTSAGKTERWCLKDAHLTISAPGRELSFRREGAGQMVSDSKPLGQG